MTLPSQSPRPNPFASASAPRTQHSPLGGTRSLFIAVAILGLGGATAGWLLTHRSDAPAANATPAEGMVVDPLAANTTPGATSPDGAVITVGTTPAPALGAPAPSPTVGGANSAPTAGVAGTAGAAPTGVTAPGTAAPTTVALGTAGQRVQQAVSMIEMDPLRARVELTRLLDSNQLSATERMAAYQGINTLAERLFFSAKIVPGDTLSQSYMVKKGDSLARIAKNEKLGLDWRFIQRINGLANERALHPDMRLKLPVGPFDAEVVKADFRLNIYSGTGEQRVMVASFPCGLGADDSTPVGTFKVRTNSKLIDPEWRNPRTGERFASNDPRNPIGERWIGLQGADASSAKFTQYGIHGTVEPQSIGKQMSMGCVRLGNAEVQVVYELITEASTVVIR